MKTFLLVLIMHNNSYVIDSHLTREDCGNAIVQGVTSVETNDGLELVVGQYALACEVEQ